MNKSRRKKSKEFTYGTSECSKPQNVVYFWYLAFVFFLHPLVMHNKYFDITKTRFTFFVFSTLAYFFLVVGLMIIERGIASYSGKSKSFSIILRGIYKKPEFWMGLFVLSNILSCILSMDWKLSLVGADARYMGLVTYGVIGVLFIYICCGRCVKEGIFAFLGVSALYAYTVGVLQHLGYDFLGYKDGIRPGFEVDYISTIGNLNIFGSYICIIVAVFLTICIFKSASLMKIFSGIIVLFSGTMIIVANSDSTYLGVGAIVFVAMLMSIRSKHIMEYLKSIIILFTGVYVGILVNRNIKGYENLKGGITGVLENTHIVLVTIIILVVLYVLLNAYFSKDKTRIENISWNKVSVIALAVTVVFAVGVIIYGMTQEWQIFKFNDEWGTYRGLNWRICGELFENGNLSEKLFGYGNETLILLTGRDYYDIIMGSVGAILDNAHNELLQYLVCLGVFGLVSYIGLVITSVGTMIKAKNKSIVVYVALITTVGYFVQSIVNIAQPITTPLYFIIMAMGVGHIRGASKGEE